MSDNYRKCIRKLHFKGWGSQISSYRKKFWVLRWNPNIQYLAYIDNFSD